MTRTIEDDVTLVNTGNIIDRCPLIDDMDKLLCASCSIWKVSHILFCDRQSQVYSYKVSFASHWLVCSNDTVKVTQHVLSEKTPNKSRNCFPVPALRSCLLAKQLFWFRSADFPPSTLLSKKKTFVKQHSSECQEVLPFLQALIVLSRGQLKGTSGTELCLFPLSLSNKT